MEDYELKLEIILTELYSMLENIQDTDLRKCNLKNILTNLNTIHKSINEEYSQQISSKDITDTNEDISEFESDEDMGDFF